MGELTMGELADDLVEGWSCSWCGIYFEEPHGYPVACRDCWKETVAEIRQGNPNNIKGIRSRGGKIVMIGSVQKAINKEL